MKAYEQYPPQLIISRWILILTQLVLGVLILTSLVSWLAIAYIGYAIFIYTLFTAISCTNCYYYGKLCSIGTGKIAAILLKKGDLSRHASMEQKGLPLLVSIWVFPILGGIVCLVIKFTIARLMLLVTFIFVVIISIASQNRLGCARCRMASTCPVLKGRVNE